MTFFIQKPQTDKERALNKVRFLKMLTVLDQIIIKNSNSDPSFVEDCICDYRSDMEEDNCKELCKLFDRFARCVDSPPPTYPLGTNFSERSKKIHEYLSKNEDSIKPYEGFPDEIYSYFENGEEGAYIALWAQNIIIDGLDLNLYFSDAKMQNTEDLGSMPGIPK